MQWTLNGGRYFPKGKASPSEAPGRSAADRTGWGAELSGSDRLGKLLLGKLHIWEVATWEITLTKLPFGEHPQGKYLTFFKPT